KQNGTYIDQNSSWHQKTPLFFYEAKKIRKISVIIAFAARKIVTDREDYTNSFFVLKYSLLE
ncbi:hypothetical protein, partial [Enterococcus faecium]|uniref:hypothetical protein n=2 Tax=Enterococcus faecium TaxID=1352 RepID=UPI00292EC96B